jgi:hypothetical protein
MNTSLDSSHQFHPSIQNEEVKNNTKELSVEINGPPKESVLHLPKLVLVQKLSPGNRQEWKYSWAFYQGGDGWFAGAMGECSRRVVE